MISQFLPKLYVCLTKGYSFATLKKDLVAGVTVGVVALPLAIAFAIASGVSPFQGIITAIVAGFCISAFGGSKVQIGGPTGAFVVLIYGIIQRHGYEWLCLATLVAAALLIGFGLFRLGSWIKYVPHPLIVGFTAGIAILIFSSQLKDFFGLTIPSSGHFIDTWSSYISHISDFSPYAIGIASFTLLTIFLTRKYLPKMPWAICSLFLASVFSYLFSLPVETIGSKFGELPRHLPLPSFPKWIVSYNDLPSLVLDGMAIALLGSIESLLSAVIADGMITSRHKSNCELVGQGIANFFSVLFGGIPATGAIARTTINVKSGAQTPVAGIIHAFTLIAILLFLAPVISLIPLSALASVLIVVAWNMCGIDHCMKMFKAPIGDLAIFLIAFSLTLLVDITIAICFGMILALLMLVRNLSKHVKIAPVEKEDDLEPSNPVTSGIEVYEIQGPFFFGTADIFQDLLKEMQKFPKIFILRLHQVPFIDASGIHALEEFYDRCVKENAELFLTEATGNVKKTLHKSSWMKMLEKKILFDNLQEATEEAKKRFL